MSIEEGDWWGKGSVKVWTFPLPNCRALLVSAGAVVERVEFGYTERLSANVTDGT
jgi:hypothetical protein